MYFRLWTSYGATVVVDQSDITTIQGCGSLLDKAISLGPIGGIFNLAVKLLDAVVQNQTVQNFKESLAVKADATMYLDQISQKVCPELEHFVAFSSTVSSSGNAGSTNYGMGNSVMERVMEVRHAKGLVAKAIQVNMSFFLFRHVYD